jgi:hypothetical protein
VKPWVKTPVLPRKTSTYNNTEKNKIFRNIFWKKKCNFFHHKL